VTSEPEGVLDLGSLARVEIVNAETPVPRYAFPGQVVVRCKIVVNGETIVTHRRVDAVAWGSGGDDLRKAIMAAVRQQAALEAVKRFPPKIEIRTY
jgi:hypothetical protein